MRVAMMTREYPPEVYGGAGVHVTELVAQLRHLCQVDVHCMGAPRHGAVVHRPDPALKGANPALAMLSADLSMANGAAGATVVHSHTWYTGLAGHLAALLYAIPHVLTAHSLEPLRPWKAEQLGGGYRISSWVERTAIEAADAVIAVSHGVRKDVLDCYPAVQPDRVHVIHNGIDPEIYRPEPSPETLGRFGIDPTTPYAFFNGRITKQKGLPLLLAAALKLDPRHQLVIVASNPDTPEIAAEVSDLAKRVRAERGNLVWIDHFISREDLIHLHSNATVFVCPSIYEPFGLVILEAMACETAVVASRVGGIPEIVVEGETGFLVDYAADATDEFITVLAARIDQLLGDTDLAAKMGRAGRRRVVERFGWPAIAAKTVELYDELLLRP
jgi:alpha-maltose-1-phosphate synthase